MMKHYQFSEKACAQAQAYQARLDILRLQAELRQIELNDPTPRCDQVPYRLSNAQYFVHELYYYLGFEHTEIARYTGIKLGILLHLQSETITTLPDDQFENLVEFYAAAFIGVIKPQCTIRAYETQSTSVGRIRLVRSSVDTKQLAANS